MDAITALELEAATWKRRQDNQGLSPEEARGPEYGSVIDKWRENHKRFIKRFPDKPNPHEFTETHYDVAVKLHELYLRYQSSVEARRVRSTSDFTRIGGYDGRDPFEAELASRHKAIETAWKEARRAVLESVPLGMMAIETIIFENKEAESLRGDLRAALNRLAILWKLARAA